MPPFYNQAMPEPTIPPSEMFSLDRLLVDLPALKNRPYTVNVAGNGIIKLNYSEGGKTVRKCYVPNLNKRLEMLLPEGISVNTLSPELLDRQNKLALESAAISHEQGLIERERLEIAQLESIYPFDPRLKARKAGLSYKFRSLGYRGSKLGARRSALKLDIAVYHGSRAPAPSREQESEQAVSASQLLASLLTSTTLQSNPQSQASHSSASAKSVLTSTTLQSKPQPQTSHSVSAKSAPPVQKYAYYQQPLMNMHQPVSHATTAYFGTPSGASYANAPAFAPTHSGTSGYSSAPSRAPTHFSSSNSSSVPALAPTYFGTSGYSNVPASGPTFAGHQPEHRQYGAQAGPLGVAPNRENRGLAMHTAAFRPKVVAKQEPPSESQVGTDSQQQPPRRASTPYPRGALPEVSPARIDPVTQREASDAQRAGREAQRQRWWEDDSDHSLTHKVPIKKEKEDDERPVFRRLLRQYESDEEGEILNTKPQRQYEDGKPLFNEFNGSY